MQACVLDTPQPVDRRPLKLRNIDRPVPSADEVLVRVRACGVCRTDLHVVEGELDQSRQKLPVIPGHQIVGEIESESRQHGLSFGDRVGIAWLNCTCGTCRFCASDRENLCEHAEFTGWTRDGGYARYCSAPAEFVYPLPGALSDEQVAPLLCAGIIGYRCLRTTGFPMAPADESSTTYPSWNGLKLGIYGFGAAGHITIQIARARGAEVYVCTRDRERHQKLADELGATWVGGTIDQPPEKLDASIIFAPAGEIIPPALQALDRGGRLVLGGIHMSQTPPIEYKDLYWEKVIQSIANNTRRDGMALLREAAHVGVKTSVKTYPLADANDALIALKHDAVRGAAVLVMD